MSSYVRQLWVDDDPLFPASAARGAGFVFAGITWVNPANGKKRWVRFNWNGISWIGTGLAVADY